MSIKIIFSYTLTAARLRIPPYNYTPCPICGHYYPKEKGVQVFDTPYFTSYGYTRTHICPACAAKFEKEAADYGELLTLKNKIPERVKPFPARKITPILYTSYAKTPYGVYDMNQIKEVPYSPWAVPQPTQPLYTLVKKEKHK